MGLMDIKLNNRDTDSFGNLKTGETFVCDGIAFMKTYLSRDEFGSCSRYVGVCLDRGIVLKFDDEVVVELLHLECREVPYER